MKRTKPKPKPGDMLNAIASELQDLLREARLLRMELERKHCKVKTR